MLYYWDGRSFINSYLLRNDYFIETDYYEGYFELVESLDCIIYILYI